MTPFETTAGGMLVAVIAGLVGNFIGGHNKVSNTHCNERRKGCNNVIVVELRSMNEQITDMKKMLRDHIISHHSEVSDGH
jgi:hypothetical protein